MASIRHLHRQSTQLLHCYRQLRAAESQFEELCDEKVEVLADVIGLRSLDRERTGDVNYLHAAAMSRCILVQRESKDTTDFKGNTDNVYQNAVYHAERMQNNSGWKTYSLLGRSQMDNVVDTTSLMVSIRNPGIFLQSELFLNICAIVGSDLMLNILLSYRMFVPEYIYRISNNVGSILVRETARNQDYSHKVCLILSRTLCSIDQDIKDLTEARRGTKPFIFIQCSGTVMYDANLKGEPEETKWSSIYLSRHVMLYRDSFNRKFGLAASDLLGATMAQMANNSPHSEIDKRNRERNAPKQNWIHGVNGNARNRTQYNRNAETPNSCSMQGSSQSWGREPLKHVAVRKLLQFVLFDRKFVSTCFEERRKAVRVFVETLNEPPREKLRWRKTSMINGIYQSFKDMLNNMMMLDIRKVYWSIFRKQGSKGSFLENSVEPKLVMQFVTTIMGSVLPISLFGASANFKRFTDVCHSVVLLNKGENLEMSQVMKGFRARGCVWNKNSEGRLTKGQANTILGYMCRVVFLLLEHLLIPLLQRHFYITETNITMYRLMYFLKADWYRMVMLENASYLKNESVVDTPDTCDLDTKSQVTDVGAQRDKFTKMKGIRVRWVPKLAGMRPIMNCSNGSMGKTGWNKGCSYNDMMQMPFHALTANVRLNPKLLGNGILGYTGALRALKQWWARFLRICEDAKKGNTLRLYVILADVSRCYDNIPHKKLLQALEKLPLHGPLLFKRVYRRDLIQVASSPNSYSRRVTVLVNEVQSSKIKETGSLMSRNMGQFSIFSRHANDYFSRKVSRKDILLGVKGLISNFKISLPKVSTQVYVRRTRGIPQGCCISPLLCSIFLAQGDMDDHVQRLTKTSSGNLFLRWIDDFIFISLNEKEALDMMQILESNSAFGVEINDKCSIVQVDIPTSNRQSRSTCVNLDAGDHKSHSNYPLSLWPSQNVEERAPEKNLAMPKRNGLAHNEAKNFVWVNSTFEFDIRNRKLNAAVTPWKSYHTTIRDSLNLVRTRSSSFMFSFLEQRLMGYLSNRLQHGLFTNPSLNGTRCILQNCYIVMRICMLKMKCATYALTRHFGGFLNCNYFGLLSHKLVEHACTLASHGGLNTKRMHIRRILQLAVIYTLNPRWLARLKRKFGRRRIRFIHSMERKFHEQWPSQG